MLAAHAAAGRDLVALRDGIFDHDLDVGERAAEALVEGPKLDRAAQGVALLVGDAVRHSIGGEQLIDGLGAPLVPDLLEPVPNDYFVFFRHVCLRFARGL